MLGAAAIGVLLLAVLYAGAVGALVLRGRREEARAFAGFVPDCAVLLRRLALASGHKGGGHAQPHAGLGRLQRD